MNAEILVKNLFSLFIMGVILEFAINVLFSLEFVKDWSQSRPVTAIKHLVVLALAIYLSYKITSLRIFTGSGISFKEFKWVDIVISALIMLGLGSFARNMISRR